MDVKEGIGSLIAGAILWAVCTKTIDKEYESTVEIIDSEKYAHVNKFNNKLNRLYDERERKNSIKKEHE